jgi:hypothetical protein
MAALVMDSMEPERSRMNAISVFMVFVGRMSKGLKVGRSEDFKAGEFRAGRWGNRQKKRGALISRLASCVFKSCVFYLPRVAVICLPVRISRVNIKKRRRRKYFILGLLNVLSWGMEAAEQHYAGDGKHDQ